MEVYEEDPAEVYRREFLQRRNDAVQAAKSRKERRERFLHKLARYGAFPIALFTVMLLLDACLPRVVYRETAITGWQERRGTRHPELYSFMQTPHFVFEVPHEVHVDYPYYATPKPEWQILCHLSFKLSRQHRWR